VQTTEGVTPEAFSERRDALIGAGADRLLVNSVALTAASSKSCATGFTTKWLLRSRHQHRSCRRMTQKANISKPAQEREGFDLSTATGRRAALHARLDELMTPYEGMSYKTAIDTMRTNAETPFCWLRCRQKRGEKDRPNQL
jgi:hypothetical protein